MLVDFLLASAHHLLFFGLIAMLAAQSVLLARPLDAAGIGRLAGIDRGYGIAAALLLLVGGARVFHGIKGADFYLHNPWFHAKLGCFLLTALLSILPTLGFLGWRRQLRHQPEWRPAPAQVRTPARRSAHRARPGCPDPRLRRGHGPLRRPALLTARAARTIRYTARPRRSGGIGRRSGLKIRRP